MLAPLPLRHLLRPWIPGPDTRLCRDLPELESPSHVPVPCHVHHRIRRNPASRGHPRSVAPVPPPSGSRETREAAAYVPPTSRMILRRSGALASSGARRVDRPTTVVALYNGKYTGRRRNERGALQPGREHAAPRPAPGRRSPARWGGGASSRSVLFRDNWWGGETW